MKVLIQAGAMIDGVDFLNRTPLHVAAETGNNQKQRFVSCHHHHVVTAVETIDCIEVFTFAKVYSLFNNGGKNPISKRRIHFERFLP